MAKKGQLAQNLKNGSDFYEHVFLMFFHSGGKMNRRYTTKCFIFDIVL